ncbi:histone-lysine N-methyltransferase, H3 lysine-79 specific-like [Anneissia japonica]|uniref:histone-lysine N-methyltransferase, H3 lysine-79 specific-like n=1 Tax=Anneissia japonica TaxID=1529436 RepID=UPI0014257931|nr:histone-lysine N-methyltransferase, H3 lysine-79 specific-like [Anneissia japonica]
MHARDEDHVRKSEGVDRLAAENDRRSRNVRNPPGDVRFVIPRRLLYEYGPVEKIFYVQKRKGDVEEEDEEGEGENYEDDDDRTVVDETEDVHVTTAIDSFLNTPEFQAPEEPESPAYDLFDDSEESRWVFNVPTPGGGGGGGGQQQQQPEENPEEREIETESLVKQVESMQREKVKAEERERKAIKTLEKEREEMAEMKRNLETRNSKSARENERKDLIFADAKNNLKRTQEELAEAKSAAERAKTEFHESRMSELEDRMKEHSYTHLNVYKSQVPKMQGTKCIRDRNLQSSESELRQQRNEIERTRKKTADYKREVDQLQNTISDLRKERKISESEIDRLRQQLTSTKELH